MSTHLRQLSSDERFYLYFLSHVPELGAVSIRNVFEAYPSPEVLVRACAGQRKDVGMRADASLQADTVRRTDAGRDIHQLSLTADPLFADLSVHSDPDTAPDCEAPPPASSLLTGKQIDGVRLAWDNLAGMKEKYDEMQSRDIRFITYYDAEYPSRLRNIHASPMVLYVIGELPSDDAPAVAIVGSRKCTNYGSSMTRYFARELAEKGVNVISGMAYGVDTWAHVGALDVPSGRTFAVLGCGVNICYPKENFDIYTTMAYCGRGGVISETIPGLNPLKKHFPMRNRIISGLSDAVLVMEAREKSGSLITADLALEQGRDVMALPGRVTDPLSRGCNALIDTGARILKSPDDVMELLGLMRTGTYELPVRDISSLTDEEKIIYRSIDTSPHYVQDIADDTKLPPGRIMSILLDLELKGYVTQVSANYYSAV